LRTHAGLLTRIVESPGRSLSPEGLERLVSQLRIVAGKTLPQQSLTYGIFSGDPEPMSRTIVTLICEESTGRPIAFNALSVMEVELDGAPVEVTHLGLVMVDPDVRGQGCRCRIRRSPLRDHQCLYRRIGCAQEVAGNRAKAPRRAVQCVLRSRTRLRVTEGILRRLLRRSEAPWGLILSDPAVERAASLMVANSATHLVIISHDPVDLIVLAVPVISTDPATETALALVRRLLALTPETA
jgi:hypothetical protein